MVARGRSSEARGGIGRRGAAADGRRAGGRWVNYWKGKAMEADRSDLRWFKSSASAVGNCVEVAHLPGGGVAVRDSKDRAKAAHVYTRPEWEAFLVGAKNGEFDLPRP
jgi:hypothetical protein